MSACALCVATPAYPQVPTILQDSTAFERPADIPSPRGAMLRSLLVPGWGQAASHRYLRGGIFFMARTATWFMLGKTLAKLGEAEGALAVRRDVARDSIVMAWEAAADPRLDQPVSLRVAIDSVGAVVAKLDLVNARKEQREDWVAQVIFWTLADGIDAYVSSHLVDFPGDVAAEPRADGGVSLRYSFPVGGRHR